MSWERPGGGDRPDKPESLHSDEAVRPGKDGPTYVRWEDLFLPEDDRLPHWSASWADEKGHFLDGLDNWLADQAMDRMRDAEPSITDDIREVDKELIAGDLIGIEFRLKGPDRFKEKLAEAQQEQPDTPTSELISEIFDYVRYTYQFKAEDYTDGIAAARERLEERGYTMYLCRNSWDSPDYKGINTRWLTPEGQRFEVQFHTPESFPIKQVTHPYYEAIRDMSVSPEERSQAREAQRRIVARVPVPERVAEIKNYRMEGY